MMKLPVAVPANPVSWCRAWDRFWFRPEYPHLLSLLRIGMGLMMCYTFLVWAIDLPGFLGPDAWIPPQLARQLQAGGWAFSYLWHIESIPMLWVVHVLAMAVLVAFTVGWMTRWTSILTAVIVLSYSHRLEGALFGLDQVNAMFALYMAVGACGDVFSVDAWLRRRRGQDGGAGGVIPKTSTNVALRLLQIHMAIIYLFGGLGKARGELWWDGFAMWFAAANSEYQSIPLTAIIYVPFLMAFLTHLTVFWETFYIATVWPKSTRWITLLIALLVHLGIAVHLGMITFGLAMIMGNAAFLSTDWIRGLVGDSSERAIRSTPTVQAS